MGERRFPTVGLALGTVVPAWSPRMLLGFVETTGLLLTAVPLHFVSFLSRNPGDFLVNFRPFCIKRPGRRTCRTILEK